MKRGYSKTLLSAASLAAIALLAGATNQSNSETQSVQPADAAAGPYGQPEWRVVREGKGDLYDLPSETYKIEWDSLSPIDQGARFADFDFSEWLDSATGLDIQSVDAIADDVTSRALRRGEFVASRIAELFREYQS